MLYEKLLEVAGVDTFAGENRCFADLDRRWPVPFCNDGQTWSRKISMRRWTLLGLLPAKHAWCRRRAGSSSPNMAANPPETGIPLTAAGQFLRCRPVLNPQKDAFSFRLRPLALMDHILSQKLLVDVGVYTFAGRNRPSAT
jgi:hypothetical protein